MKKESMIAEAKVKKFIIDNNLINPGDVVIIGLSGGADSVCLLAILNSLKEDIGFSIKAVHVHHGIRQKTADEDEYFADTLCQKMGIDYEAFRENIPKLCEQTKESTEECGRRIRYEIFEKVSAVYKESKIAVAHHMNDQAETVLFRMARGSGIKGLSGMEPQRGKIIRPLLCLTREEIEEYLYEANLEYRTDETNEDTKYSRNYVRKKVLPKLEKVNTNAVKHIVTLASEAAEIQAYLEKEAKELLDSAIIRAKDTVLSEEISPRYETKRIVNADRVIGKVAIRKILSDANVSLKDISHEHIEQIIEMFDKSEAKEIVLPRGLFIKCEADYAVLCRKKEVDKHCKDFEMDIAEEGEYITPNGHKVKISFSEDFDRNNIPTNLYTKWFDYDKICSGLCLRTRRSGDYLTVSSDGSRKKLKEYLINEKIPKSERDSVLLIANGERIAWVIGHRISEDVKVNENTKKIMIISIEKEQRHGR